MKLVERMLSELPFSLDEIRSLVATAQFRYKVYPIPKRQPGQFRLIAQPTPEVKLLQRWLISAVFSVLPIHRAAKAYRDKTSIADHATVHAGNRFLLKMDFKDFFHSIVASDVERLLLEKGKYSLEEASLIAQIVCWRNKRQGTLCLSIGAPSSPILSNILMYEFDKRISTICRAKKVKYTRYADDLAFSTSRKNVLADLEADVESVCRQINFPQLTINRDKTVSTSKKFRRVLAGLVLTTAGEVSLGREKKRALRAEVHRYTNGTLAPEAIGALRGRLAFAWSVEPDYVRSLLRKYGNETFAKLELPFRE